MKRRIVVAGVSTIVVAALVMAYFAYVEVDINKEYDAVIYSTEDQFEQTTKITLEGELYRNPFGKDTFVGDLTVDTDITYRIKLDSRGDTFSTSISVLDPKDSTKSLTSIGTVTLSRDLEEIWMTSTHINERHHLKYSNIVGPANTSQEANELLDRIFNKEGAQ